jgi:hypothetical protein
MDTTWQATKESLLLHSTDSGQPECCFVIFLFRCHVIFIRFYHASYSLFKIDIDC